MRSSHQLLALPVFAGIAAAGLCRPGSSSITTAVTAIQTETSANADTKTSLTQTLSFSASEIISATTLEAIVPVKESPASQTTTAPLIETSATKTTTAAFTGFTSDIALTTSFATSSAADTAASETTTSQATTTTSLIFPPQPIICPGSDRMCLYNMDIRCDYQLAGLPKDGNMSLDECAEECGKDARCILFSWDPSDSSCYMGSYDDLEVEDWIPGVVSGLKGECEEPEP